MKRHLPPALLRLFLAAAVACAFPFSHARWGQPIYADGPQALFLFILFLAIALGGATVFFGLGSLAQFLFRRQPAPVTIAADLILFFAFTGTLIYGGVAAF